MDEQMIGALARKLAMFMFDTWGDAEGVVWAGLDPSQREKATKAARAAHSVMAGKVAELTEALREARGGLLARGAGPESKTVGQVDAALAPHPKPNE